MSKTTTGNQSSNRCALLAIPPNTAPATGPGAPPSPTAPAGDPPAFDGVPEHVPELTFMSTPRVANDDFLNGAETYHNTCGLATRRVDSLAQMVQFLSEDGRARFNRVRLITHASGDDLILPFFGQTNVPADRHTLEEHLNGFAESDERGLLSILMLNPGAHFFGWSNSTILSLIRGENASLLAPYGIDGAGLPPSDLQRFMFYCCDLAFVNADRVRLNNNPLNTANRNGLRQAIERLIALTAPTTGAAALRTFLTGRPIADLGPAPTHRYHYTAPANSINIFLLAGRAAAASEAGFRAQLTSVRNRLDGNSTIDIRGCRAGQHTSYLRAVQKLFGRDGNRPKVTGPRWYQYFGPCQDSVINNNAQLHNLIQTGAQAENNRLALAEWARRGHVDARHKTFWLTHLARDRGKVIRFCQLGWRGELPSLAPPLEPVGWPAFLLLGFRQAIPRIAEFFNVTGAAVPGNAALTTLEPLVTTRLDGYASFLFATVDEANKAATFTALSQLDTELGTTLVPDTAPTPLSVSQVIGYQQALIDSLEANQLAPIRDFMAACQTRIEDELDPGIFYYLINVGLPAFLFRDTERMLGGHRVQVAHNRIVVHNSFRNPAFHQWIRLLWAEPLPAGNTVDSQTIGTADAQRFAMMVRTAEVGDTDVAACPHPDYMAAIETVTNTPDSLF